MQHARTRFPLHLVRQAMRSVRRKAFLSLAVALCVTGLWLTQLLPSFLQKQPSLQQKTPPPHVQPVHKRLFPAGQFSLSPHLSASVRQNTSVPTSDSGRHFVTVIPRGRLGNQMFQYASLLGIADVNDRQAFVSSSCKVTHYFTNISVSDRPVSSWDTVEEENYAEKDPHLDSLPDENVRLKGFFQSWKYFAGISHQVKQAFTFLPDVQQAVQAFFTNATNDMKNDLIKIGVHVRRTDMLHKVTQKQGYVPAPLSYLRKAFQHMRVRFGSRSTFFYIVSDDPDWCSQNLLENGVKIVDPAPSVVHLGFLGLCDHVIMTVGTFGWWAAYLAGGHVVYYAGFPREGSEIAEGFNKQHFYLPHWVGIGD